MSAANASVWAVVLTAGGEEVTAACIESLLAQDYAPLTVLLVDNDSQDGSGKRLEARYPRIRYLNTGSNCGYAGGNNRGIALALGNGADHLMVINNDTIAEPGCVAALVRTAREGSNVGAVSPKILYFDDPGLIWYGGGTLSRSRAIGIHDDENQRDAQGATRARSITFATGCCVLLPAAVARSSGGFAEDFFMYCEDVDLSLRLSRSGYTMYYQPEARVLHRKPVQGDAPSPFQIRLRDRNRRRMVRRHYSLGDRLAFAGWFYPTRAVRCVMYLARGDWPRARAILAGVTEA
mgnify:CR=1 FL=1